MSNQDVVVRVSLGFYPPEKEAAVASALDYSGTALARDIEALPGLISYHSAIDRANHALINVSTWKDLASAEQMGRLQSMLDRGGELAAMGVTFVRPIPNGEVLWRAQSSGARS